MSSLIFGKNVVLVYYFQDIFVRILLMYSEILLMMVAGIKHRVIENVQVFLLFS